MRYRPSIAEAAAQAHVASQAAGVPQQVREFIINHGLGSQETVLPFPYYSAALFQSVQAAGPPITQTILQQDRLCFSYGQNTSMQAAGFPVAPAFPGGPGGQATEAETNLKNGTQTNDNSDVELYGLGLELDPTSDPLLTQLIFQNTFVQLSLNGSTTYKLGRLANYPYHGGLSGSQRSLLEPAETFSTVAEQEGFLTNGLPLGDSFGWWPDDMIFHWYATGGQERDIALTLNLRLARNIVFTSRRLPRVAVNGGAGTSGTEAWQMPNDGFQGTWVEIVATFAAVQVGSRSKNS